jgi:hypothetical protein
MASGKPGAVQTEFVVLRDFARVIAASRATTTIKAFIVADFMTNSPGSAGWQSPRCHYCSLSEPTSSMYN